MVHIVSQIIRQDVGGIKTLNLPPEHSFLLQVMRRIPLSDDLNALLNLVLCL